MNKYDYLLFSSIGVWFFYLGFTQHRYSYFVAGLLFWVAAYVRSRRPKY